MFADSDSSPDEPLSRSRDRKWYLIWEIMLMEKGWLRVARWRHSSGVCNSMFVLVDKTVMRQTKWGHAKKSGQDQGVFRPEGQSGGLRGDYAAVVNSLDGLGGGVRRALSALLEDGDACRKRRESDR